MYLGTCGLVCTIWWSKWLYCDILTVHVCDVLHVSHVPTLEAFLKLTNLCVMFAHRASFPVSSPDAWEWDHMYNVSRMSLYWYTMRQWCLVKLFHLVLPSACTWRGPITCRPKPQLCILVIKTLSDLVNDSEYYFGEPAKAISMHLCSGTFSPVRERILIQRFNTLW